jgi:hypothetical protein
MPIYQQVHPSNLVPGTYRVKHLQRDLGLLDFVRIEHDDVLGIIHTSTIRIRIPIDNHSFYRIVPPHEYLSKLRIIFDKHDNGLNSIIPFLS